MTDEIIELREAIIKRDDNGTFVTIRKAFVDPILDQQTYAQAAQEIRSLGFEDPALPKKKLIVSLACRFAEFTKEQAFKYLNHPKMESMISEFESAALIFKGPLDAAWQVPVYVVYLPPL